MADGEHIERNEDVITPGIRGARKIDTAPGVREGTDGVAHRPGRWRCEGMGNRGHAVAVFQAMQAAQLEVRPPCGLRASWRTIGAAAGTDAHGCIGSDNAVFAARDNMVEATQRKASCRRADAQQ